jgi:hypothetical protein
LDSYGEISGFHGTEYEMKMAIFWDVALYSLEDIVLMMETVNSSVTSVSIYQTTRRSIPEDSHHLDSCGPD